MDQSTVHDILTQLPDSNRENANLAEQNLEPLQYLTD